MSDNQKRLLNVLRDVCIQMLNVLDDILEKPRTIPSKSQRQRLRKQIDAT